MSTIATLKHELKVLNHTIRLMHDATFTGRQIELQRHIVNTAYDKEPMGDVYQFEFDVLSNMNRLNMAEQERRERGLPDGAKTNYCD